MKKTDTLGALQAKIQEEHGVDTAQQRLSLTGDGKIIVTGQKAKRPSGAAGSKDVSQCGVQVKVCVPKDWGTGGSGWGRETVEGRLKSDLKSDMHLMTKHGSSMSSDIRKERRHKAAQESVLSKEESDGALLSGVLMKGHRGGLAAEAHQICSTMDELCRGLLKFRTLEKMSALN